ncbi:MAG: GNAT family N-acetyltransferase [Candidatus Bipolaricaulota bacterium]|nr:GNAT family N-acetyltransferase [Candidatus Bipolaricaulota bacterium]
MFSIREATPGDNEALLRLEAESPQGTGISILIDRDDYFYRSRMHDRARVLLATENDRVVGVMAYAIKDVLLDGARDRVAYFYDLRGDATYRRSMKRGLLRLWQAVHEEVLAAGAALLYGHVKCDNYDSLNVVTRLGAQEAASFDILTLPSLRGPTVPLSDHLDALGEEIARIDRAVGQRSLKPAHFAAAYERGAELGYLKGIFRLEIGGSSAQVSAWDLSGIYRGRVVHMPLSLRALGWFLNPLATVLPVPRVPIVGQQISYLQLFDPVCSGPRGHRLLKALISQIRRNAHAEGIDILTLFVYRDDPLAHLPNFTPQTVLHYHTMVFPLRRAEPPSKPLYLDIRDI